MSPQRKPAAAVSGSNTRSGSESGMGPETGCRWERAVLDELVYERVRLNVDLLELVDFERDLAASIERSLAACGASEDRDRLAREHLERAWVRLESEWRQEREAAADLQCPLCGELTTLGP